MEKKKAVITMLGTISKNRDGEFKKVKYGFDKSIIDTDKKVEYVNTFPLLIALLEDEYDIIPIYTKLSLLKQNETLIHHKIDFNIIEKGIKIVDENNFKETFKVINEVISSDKYNELIIDLTHGFRHLPILTTVSMIINNIKDSKKIKNILFAKEEDHVDHNSYKIIDLKEYLDIANLTYVLNSFNDSYTVSNNILQKDETVDLLREFSQHFLANSLGKLLDKKNSLIEKIIDKLKEKDDVYYSDMINNIIEHLEKLNSLKDEPMYIRLFEFAKVMRKRGYYLNSITLLNEAVAWYCAYSLQNYSQSFKDKYKSLQNNDNYKLISNSKYLVLSSFNGKKFNNDLNIKDISSIQDKVNSIPNCEKFGNTFIKEMNDFRNNLAHANSGENIDNVSKSLERLFGQFQTHCITNDILNIDNN